MKRKLKSLKWPVEPHAKKELKWVFFHLFLIFGLVMVGYWKNNYTVIALSSVLIGVVVVRLAWLDKKHGLWMFKKE